MAKIYNEIVIDMNPESSTFEETLHEDSFEYNGDMMLASHGSPPLSDGEYSAGQFAEGDKVWVTEDATEGAEMYRRYKVVDGRWVNDNYVTHDPVSHGGGVGKGVMGELPGNEFIVGYNPESIGERGLGMGDVTAEDMLGMSEDEMLKWIIDTRYGGKLPTGITDNDILTQIRTKLPQKGGVTGTDWYGIQDTAGDVAGAGRSVYGGMGTGMRQQIAGQKQIGKDIYALEEDKGKDWTTKFRTFLSSLPSATGTG